MTLTIDEATTARLLRFARDGETASETLQRALTQWKRATEDVETLRRTLADTRRRLADTDAYMRRHPGLSRAQERGIDKARADFHEFTGSYPEAAGE